MALKNLLLPALRINRIPGREKRDGRYPHVFILGMHRSGTSCLTGMLESHGLYIGDVSRKNRFNKKGLLENSAARKANQQILKSAGATWRAPKRISEITEELQNEITDICRKMDRRSSFWGIKDPRMLFCLDLWRKPSSHIIGTFRHPHSVAKSLIKRHTGKNPFTLGAALKLWHLYNVELIRIYRDEAFPVVSFDWEPSRYKEISLNIARELSLTKDGGDFFEASLRQNNCTEDIEDPDCRELYNELTKISEIEERKLRQT